MRTKKVGFFEEKYKKYACVIKYINKYHRYKKVHINLNYINTINNKY